MGTVSAPPPELTVGGRELKQPRSCRHGFEACYGAPVSRQPCGRHPAMRSASQMKGRGPGHVAGTQEAGAAPQ